MNALKEWALIARNVLIALAVIAVGELLPPLQALEQWIAPQRELLAWRVGGVAFLGWACLMGATIYRAITGGGSLTRQEIADHVGRVRSHQAAPMAVARGWRIWLPKRAQGAGFSDELSVAQFKAGWRHALWRHDRRWRGLFIMAFGAALMAVGGFGLIIVLATPGLKLLAGGALAYAIVRVSWMFLKA